MNIFLVILLAVGANLPIGYIAIRNKSLTLPGGSLVAGILGITLFIAHPIYWIELMIFFLSSTLFSKFQLGDKKKMAAMDLAEKNDQRDILQVIANGIISFLGAVLCIMIYGIVKSPIHLISIVIITSIAVSNADTWATELGVLSNKEPYLITNLRERVARGTSGGISILGLFASILGSGIIAITYFIGVQIIHSINPWIILIITIGGTIGSIIDSLLGATLQINYQCPRCEKVSEKTFHIHNERVQTNPIKGIKWVSNDIVNFISALLAVFISSFIYWVIF